MTIALHLTCVKILRKIITIRQTKFIQKVRLSHSISPKLGNFAKASPYARQNLFKKYDYRTPSLQVENTSLVAKKFSFKKLLSRVPSHNFMETLNIFLKKYFYF